MTRWESRARDRTFSHADSVGYAEKPIQGIARVFFSGSSETLNERMHKFRVRVYRRIPFVFPFVSALIWSEVATYKANKGFQYRILQLNVRK